MLDPLELLTPSADQDPKLPLLVYCPGMDGTGTLFYQQIPRLAPYFRIRTIRFTPAVHADWVHLSITLWEKLGSESIYLVGESFGACLALQTAVQVPQQIQRLILINPATSFRKQGILAQGSQLVDYVPLWVYGLSAYGLVPFLANGDRVAPRDRNKLFAAMCSVPLATTAHRLAMLRTFELQGWHVLTMPVLLLASAKDRMLPSVVEARALHNLLPHATIQILPQSGHAALIETQINLSEILNMQGFLPKIGKEGLVSDDILI